MTVAIDTITWGSPKSIEHVMAYHCVKPFQANTALACLNVRLFQCPREEDARPAEFAGKNPTISRR
jgi:hypothetical protein